MFDHRSDDVIQAEEAARELEVPVEQIAVLVDQGVLTPVDDGDGNAGFSRAEVAAARMMGG